jgi:hypothetical protein
LNGVPDTGKTLVPADAIVWDVDAEDTTAETIAALHTLGKTVICYFSAGTYENWRPDAKQFPTADLGTTLDKWPNEKWIRLSSTGIRNVMKSRISRAAAKGCDAIDPDNTGMFWPDWPFLFHHEHQKKLSELLTYSKSYTNMLIHNKRRWLCTSLLFTS